MQHSPPSGSATSTTLWHLGTLTVALLGGWLAYLARLPLPWTLGPMLACLALAAWGQPVRVPKAPQPFLRAILGIAIGANFSPAIVQRAGDFALSLALLPFYVTLVGILSYQLLHRLFRLDRVTALFGGMPGGLIDMVTIGSDLGGASRTLTLLHATRVAVVVASMSAAVALLPALEAQPFRQPPLFSPLADLPLVCVLAAVGWWGAARLNVPGASIIGPMFVSAVLHGAGLVSAHPIYVLIIAAQVVIGGGLGCQFRNVTAAELAGPILAGFVTTLCSFLPLTLAVLLLVQAGLVPLSVLLAYAPGGQAEMNILALAIGADIAFISLHHILRVFLVILCTPLLRRVIGSAPAKDPGEAEI